jgi:hypothetical protein
MSESLSEAIHRRIQEVLESRRKANASGQDGEDVQHIRAAFEAAADKCKGIEIEPGVYSGCDASAGDCPTCGK